MKKIFIFTALFICSFYFVNAQLSIYNIPTASTNANQLVDKLVGTGVVYSNPTFTGSTSGTNAGNAGYFSGGSSVVGLNSGIVISTGN